MPERIERLVAITSAVPAGYRWHRWRSGAPPILGAAVHGLQLPGAMKRASAMARRPGPAPDEMVDAVWDHFDHGTQRAILKLYRSARRTLEAAGEGSPESAPRSSSGARNDPYLPTDFAHQLGDRLGGPRAGRGDRGRASLAVARQAELVDEVAGFLLVRRPVSRHLVL